MSAERVGIAFAAKQAVDISSCQRQKSQSTSRVRIISRLHCLFAEYDITTVEKVTIEVWINKDYECT